jgi:hypothetical protein
LIYASFFETFCHIFIISLQNKERSATLFVIAYPSADLPSGAKAFGKRMNLSSPFLKYVP